VAVVADEGAAKDEGRDVGITVVQDAARDVGIIVVQDAARDEGTTVVQDAAKDVGTIVVQDAVRGVAMDVVEVEVAEAVEAKSEMLLRTARARPVPRPPPTGVPRLRRAPQRMPPRQAERTTDDDLLFAVLSSL
jgi:hypothetical protein